METYTSGQPAPDPGEILPLMLPDHLASKLKTQSRRPAVVLNKYFATSVLVDDAKMIARRIEAYVSTITKSPDWKEEGASIPTPEGLARAVGFSNWKRMADAITEATTPEESRHYLMIGASILVEEYTKRGLIDKLSTAFTKFILSAQLNVTEKTERLNVNENDIRITWGEDQTPQTNQLTHQTNQTKDPDLIEMERLESALPPSMSMTKASAPNTNPVTRVQDLF